MSKRILVAADGTERTICTQEGIAKRREVASQPTPERLCDMCGASYLPKRASRTHSTCGECKRRYGCDVVARWSAIRWSAQKRRLEFSLEPAMLSEHWGGPCFYCGVALHSVGFDRVDNAEGYHAWNVVTCCPPCNSLKGVGSPVEMLQRVERIYNRHIRKK